jgi:O-antigen ligase
MKNTYYALLLAITGTTLFSWFNVNSCLIILLVICRLVDGGRPFDTVRTAFSNPFFLAYFSLFTIEVLGLIYTHDLFTAWKHVESKATLVALPFFFCSGIAVGRKEWRQFLWGYCWLLAAAGLFCLGVALDQFLLTGEWGSFFYHALTESIGVNAVFFSGYVIMALLFLLSREGKGKPRGVLVVFFTVMLILLASKLLLVFQAVVFLIYLKGWSRVRWKTRRFTALAALVVAGTGVLAVTNNPVGERYQEILHDDLRYTGKCVVPPHAVFNGISLRLKIWQFAGEIMREQKAWVIGVSSGESQDLLNRKYFAANMSSGFIGYNYHNEYVELLVRSGWIGLLVYLAATVLLVELARRTATKEGWFAFAMLLSLAITESTLEMQHSAFLTCFFPLLFAYAGKSPVNLSSNP